MTKKVGYHTERINRLIKTNQTEEIIHTKLEVIG